MHGLFAKLGRVTTGREARRDETAALVFPTAAVSGGNIVPFARHVVRLAPALTAAAVERSMPATNVPAGRSLGCFALSLVLHAGVWAVLMQPAQPVAGIELPAIAVDLVFGADTPAGPARKSNTDRMAQSGSAQPKQVPPTERKHSRTPAADRHPAPHATPADPPVAREPPMQETGSEPPVSSAVGHADSPPAAKQEGPVSDRSTPRRNTKRASEPQRQRAHRRSHPRSNAAPSRIARGRSRAPEPGADRAEAGGVGRGRSAAFADYYGLVAAHLARYKRFPAEARNTLAHGRARVSFTLDGRGRVVSVRLLHATGVATLDREAQAMVHRASPFPPPPDGRPHTFRVPVSFHIR